MLPRTIKCELKRNDCLKNLQKRCMMYLLQSLGVMDIKTTGDLLQIFVRIDFLTKQLKSKCNVNFLCKEGCASCCSEYFYVSKTEYMVIVDYLAKSKADIHAIIQKSRRIKDFVKSNYKSEYAKLISNTVSLDDFNDNGLSLNVPCIFLQDNKCTVYNVRPIICRLYGISSEYNLCHKVAHESSSKSLDSMTVPIPYAPEWQYGIDYEMVDNKVVLHKPYPLFWWFSDKEQVIKDIKRKANE